MSDLRKYITIIEAAQDKVRDDLTPPEFEDGDEDHYAARDETGFFGAQAAGAILMARTTGRIMLVLRSKDVEEPFTWGNCGGAMHAHEKPEAKARTEIQQETGYTGRVELVPLYVFRKPTSRGEFRYYNFLGIVEDEFEPHLGWEADDHEWCEFGDWPHPLHFGIEGILRDAASVETIKREITKAKSA